MVPKLLVSPPQHYGTHCQTTCELVIHYQLLKHFSRPFLLQTPTKCEVPVIKCFYHSISKTLKLHVDYELYQISAFLSLVIIFICKAQLKQLCDFCAVQIKLLLLLLICQYPEAKFKVVCAPPRVSRLSLILVRK